MYLRAISLHQIVQPMWIAGRRQEAITRSNNCLRDVATQTNSLHYLLPTILWTSNPPNSAHWMQHNGVFTH